MEKINVTLPEGSKENHIITILEGEALEQRHPEKIQLAGDIRSISAFLEKRKSGYGQQNVDPNKVVVVVDKEAMKITMYLDPENPFGTAVTGSMEKSPELQVFHINESKTFRREELVQLLRFNRIAFDNKEQHEKILKAYMAFDAKVDTELKAESDTRGNKAAAVKKAVTTNIPTEFVLSIPVFKGMEAKTFRVEICLDVTDGGARFWFESTELKELIDVEKEILINEELKSCKEFVIINK